MAVDITPVLGLVFTHEQSGTEYGIIRATAAPTMHPAGVAGRTVVAEDECGNAFLLTDKGHVVFWDHETDKVTALANSWADFVRGCAQPRPVALDPDQVRAVWIDPAFAKQLGLEVPPDGWKKRPLE